MPVQPGFAEYCRELLAPCGDVTGKRMFGGYGIYVDGTFVAIIVDDTLYLKADELTRDTFAQAGGQPFVFESQGKQQVTSYWTVPEAAMDSPGALEPWARLAMQAALRKPEAKKKKKK